MKEKSHIIVLFVMPDLLRNTTLNLMLQLSMKEKSQRNVTSVINLFQQIQDSDFTLHQFMKESNHLSATSVNMQLQKNQF